MSIIFNILISLVELFLKLYYIIDYLNNSIPYECYMKIKFILFAFVVLLITACCFFPCSQDNSSLLAFTAIINNSSEYLSKIILTDYYNMTSHKIISPDSLRAVKAIFSPDKDKILVMSNQNKMYLYNIEKDSLMNLYVYDSIHVYDLVGKNPIWDLKGEGIFYSTDSWYGESIYYYDIHSHNISCVYSENSVSSAVLGQISPDSLIVFSNKYYHELGDSNCYFIMSISGEYILKIVNPYLKLINIDGITKKGAYDLNWNNEINQFVYFSVDSSKSGYQISVTDFTGIFNKEYTNSYYDSYPVWGPKDYIFFNRFNEIYDEDEAYILNMNTRKVRPLKNSISISNSVLLYNITY